jgi:hypothetical protein
MRRQTTAEFTHSSQWSLIAIGYLTTIRDELDPILSGEVVPDADRLERLAAGMVRAATLLRVARDFERAEAA